MLDPDLRRLGLIVAVAVLAHIAVLVLRAGSRQLLSSRLHSEAKARTITGFATSVSVFGVYFAAIGFVLAELGVSLTTYLASASVIGLAVSFGSQGVVQDVINGLTVVFSDLIDVGDMVDLGGQVGIVESVGMRFTVLVNFAGARVFVPNRSIASVINYTQGFVRVYLDVVLPADRELRERAERAMEEVADAAYEQYPGILLLPPTIEAGRTTRAGYTYLRVKFRVWPGQGAMIEGPVRQRAIKTLQKIDPDFGDWMVSVHYRAEPPDRARALPRPAVLATRSRGSRG